MEHITDPGDIKGLKPDQLRQLADESRAYLIETLSGAGGHLASNLGVVELSPSDTPKETARRYWRKRGSPSASIKGSGFARATILPSSRLGK